jgi:methyltransferase OMS1
MAPAGVREGLRRDSRRSRFIAMRVTPWHIVGGVGLYGASAYGFYRYLSAHKLSTDKEGSSDMHGGVHAFDLIADKYDAAVGSEEFSMGTPLLRRWILNHASGACMWIVCGGVLCG